MDLSGPTPKITDLIAHGMCDYSLRAVEFDPPVGNRGIQASSKPVTWSCTITSTNAARPMVRALRANPDEAERDARLRYMAIFAKGKKDIHPISEEPKPEKKAKPKPVVSTTLDDEASSLL